MNRQLASWLPNILVPLGGLSTDIYLPSLPAMSDELFAADSKIQLTITAYVLAMALGQYIAGPVSDALGRKRLIIGSLLIQLVMNVAIILAPSATWIIVARFFQGLASAFMIVPARAILTDCFQGSELKKKFNYLTISFAIAPIVAPFIGGFCQHFFGWRAGFIFLIAYILLLLTIMIAFSEETIAQTKRFSPMHVLHNYQRIMNSKAFILPTIFVSTMFGFTSIFAVLGPFIFQESFGVNPLQYGYIALSVGFAWLLGNITNRVFFDFPQNAKVLLSLGLQTICVAYLILNTTIFPITFSKLFICQFILVFSAALVFPIYVAEGLACFTDIAASSNAFLFASTWIAFSLYSLLATKLSHTNLLPLALCYAGVNLAGYLLFWRINLLARAPQQPSLST